MLRHDLFDMLRVMSVSEVAFIRPLYLVNNRYAVHQVVLQDFGPDSWRHTRWTRALAVNTA